MANTTNINIRMDADLKADFEQFCSEIGLSMSAAMNVFAKAAVRQQRIPFEVSAQEDPFYSKSNMDHLTKAIDDYESGRTPPIVMTMNELEAMAADE